ncbi:hypothetical protein EWM64_g1970 [Hericium alpestre]|uniref:RNase H type-1 domain-containing protein n=1 Tax=Hericium alpestre TaxID=135208 RepID=A0A4Z0A4T6_9AGAM|nr:hypothetical protein EWM64_g1970 [Hericium alpestre]
MVLFPTIDFAPTVREFRDIVVTLVLWRSRVKTEKVLRRKAVYEALSKHPALEQMAPKLPGATRWEKLDYYSRGGAQRKEKHFRQAAFYGQTGARARVMMLYCWIVASLLPPEADISNLTPLPDFVDAKVADECPNYASVDWDAFISEAEGRFGDKLVKFDVQDSPSMLLNPDLQPGQIIIPADSSSYRLMIWCVKALELGHPITGDGSPVLSAHFNVYLPSDWKASKPKPKRTLSLPAPEPTLLIMPNMQHAETFSGRPTSPPPAYTSTRPTSMHSRQGTMNSIKSMASAANKLSEKAEKLGPLASKFSDKVEKLGPLANKWSEKAGPLAGKFSEKASGWLHAAGKAIPGGDLTAAIMDTVAEGVDVMAVLVVLQLAPNFALVLIKSDLHYVIDSLTKRLSSWKDRGWINIANNTLFRAIAYHLWRRSASTAFQWVKGHAGDVSNESADALAKLGVEKPDVDNIDISVPHDFHLQGARLSALTLSNAYGGIHELLTLTPHHVCQFIYRLLHNLYKVGPFWEKIPAYAVHARCPLCEDKTESMSHILTECSAPTVALVWGLAKSLWPYDDSKWPATTLGNIMSVGQLTITSGPTPDEIDWPAMPPPGQPEPVS